MYRRLVACITMRSTGVDPARQTRFRPARTPFPRRCGPIDLHDTVFHGPQQAWDRNWRQSSTQATTPVACRFPTESSPV